MKQAGQRLLEVLIDSTFDRELFRELESKDFEIVDMIANINMESDDF